MAAPRRSDCSVVKSFLVGLDIRVISCCTQMFSLRIRLFIYLEFHARQCPSSVPGNFHTLHRVPDFFFLQIVDLFSPIRSFFFFCIQLEFRFIFLLLRCAFLLRILICPRAHIWSARVCPVFFCIDFLRNQFPPIFYEKSYIFFGAFEIHATCTQIGGQAAGFKTVSVDQNKK